MFETLESLVQSYFSTFHLSRIGAGTDENTTSKPPHNGRAKQTQSKRSIFSSPPPRKRERSQNWKHRAKKTEPPLFQDIIAPIWIIIPVWRFLFSRFFIRHTQRV